MRRLIIIAHGDADGICSAALVYAALSKNYHVYFSHPADLHKDLLEVIRGRNLY